MTARAGASTTSIVVLVASFIVCSGAGLAAQLEVEVRGPDGQPVRNAPVRIQPASRDSAAPDGFHARTDAAGVFRINWPAGVARVEIRVPGVGYGTTGAVDV